MAHGWSAKPVQDALAVDCVEVDAIPPEQIHRLRRVRVALRNKTPWGLQDRGNSRRFYVVHVRTVWKHNVQQEFGLIRAAVLRHRHVAMDTEYPGVLYRPSCHLCAMMPDQHYGLLKDNVDALNVVQIGFTLSDPYGRLLDLGHPGVGYVWQFNIRGFHPRRDPHSPESVELLWRYGIDFDAINREGVEPRQFAPLLIFSGLLNLDGPPTTWVTFQAVYHFALLIKILTAGQGLPPSLGGFMNLVRCYFGDMVFDVKYVMHYCNGLHGGLDKVSGDLEVGNAHQAGSTSLLTMQVFRKMLDLYFAGGGVEQHAGRLFGLGLSGS